ncbi:lipoprotein insertase outer membrane protein LolB [Methylococcus capsulatus]|jgi:outer membrane lipoprotein LolB|uniref:Outer-membrane lipoprotein LolB n=1 Tax=Methylococcus capsulatus TaxID=414 RepID=A0AA35UC07_METCP|nr:lipoprotein insertase outer membrane protein LolB [Methylococcus capsulatus]CAI8729181.1 outer membrane lipoprotein LolB [Methylococcus capsulatus]
MRGRLRLAAVSLTVLAAATSLQGCGPAPVRSGMPGSVRLAGLERWRLEGRVAVQTADDAWQASLSWDHDGRQDRLRISGPLNQGTVSIVLQDDLILVNEGSGNESISRDPEGLLKEKLGFSIPLPSLRYWVLGVAAPGNAGEEMEFYPDGRLKHFKQAEWSLDYERYRDWDQFTLPQKVSIQGRSLKLKLFADEWSVGNPPS